MTFRKSISLSVLSAITALLMICFTYAEAASASKALYVNGGIGTNEANEIRGKASEFNLRLYMSEGERGSFISGAKIIITDKDNNVVLNIPRGGPILFAKVEDGSYRISATYKRTKITKKVEVDNATGENVYLIWEANKTNENIN